jgi:hypothetical protein
MRLQGLYSEDQSGLMEFTTQFLDFQVQLETGRNISNLDFEPLQKTLLGQKNS